MKHSFVIPQHESSDELTEENFSALSERIKNLIKSQNAVLISHFYTNSDIQRLTDETGGFVGDSLDMAKFGQNHSATTLIICGVRFMGESAKILSPQKRILMPTLAATCSLDLGCPIGPFNEFCNQHPDRIVVVYANTSAAVKARADWVVTSSNALNIIDHLDAEGHKILWAPDRYLGRYLAEQTGADMVLWDSSCVVHEEFKAQGIKQLKQLYPEAAVLVHPESPQAVIEMADVVGATSVLFKASQQLPHEQFIVATDRGILYKMRQSSPTKQFIEAPTAGNGATCKACGHCPWMSMNSLAKLEQSLISGSNEICIAPEVIDKARIPLQRMLDFGVKSLSTET